MVYKYLAYKIYYKPLYVKFVDDHAFFAIKIDDAMETIALCKLGKKQLINRETSFDYNAENNNVCVKIPNYMFS